MDLKYIKLLEADNEKLHSLLESMDDQLNVRRKLRDDNIKHNTTNCILATYYPYGTKKTYVGGLAGTRNLTKDTDIPEGYLKRTKEELIISIFKELARAIYYLNVYQFGIGYNKDKESSYEEYEIGHKKYKTNQMFRQADTINGMWNFIYTHKKKIEQMNIKQLRALMLIIDDYTENLC